MNNPRRYGGLTPTQFRIVDELAKRGQMIPPVLARVIGVPQSDLGGSVCSLRRKGFVEAPIIPYAGQVLELTEAGQDVSLP